MITSINFRGESRDVEYRDHGYEMDTGAHEIEWHFVDEEMKGVELTQEEMESVFMQLADIGPDYWPDDVI